MTTSATAAPLHSTCAAICPDLLAALQDMVQNLAIAPTIAPGVAIAHPRFGAIEISPDRAAQLLSLPPTSQQRYVTLQLRNFLYEAYYSGERRSHSVAEVAPQAASPALENHLCHGMNRVFYDKLHQSNQGKGYYEPGWEKIGTTQDLVIVRKQDLTLHVKEHQLICAQSDRSIPTNSLLDPEDSPSSNPAQIVSVWTPAYRIESGFYLAIGDVGWIHVSLPDPQRQVIILEFNSDAIGAIDLMHELTTQLNALAIPFTFKVPYNADDYDRYNTGTLWLYKDDYALVQPTLLALYETYQQHFRPEIPLLTKALAPGLAIAELSCPPTSESFGLDRCQLLATRLLETVQQDYTPAQRLTQILQTLQQECAPNGGALCKTV